MGAYETALDRLGEATRHVDVMVPGHGVVAEGPEVVARLAAARAHVDAHVGVVALMVATP